MFPPERKARMRHLLPLRMHYSERSCLVRSSLFCWRIAMPDWSYEPATVGDMVHFSFRKANAKFNRRVLCSLKLLLCGSAFVFAKHNYKS